MTPDPPEGPTVGLSVDEFVQAFEDLHRMLDIPLPDALT